MLQVSEFINSQFILRPSNVLMNLQQYLNALSEALLDMACSVVTLVCLLFLNRAQADSYRCSFLFTCESKHIKMDGPVGRDRRTPE